MIHTGSKPFKCITCQKTFYQANSLKKSHLKKNHTEAKTCKYITCQKTFSHASTLNTHELTYNGFKDFKTFCHARTLKSYEVLIIYSWYPKKNLYQIVIV